ncbi:hypothetical protein [Flagellimonas sp.]|uniref:hypothetical protein n=1 Tax=Flagellimonas sp. TaxID=2058762 RepID=UPI003F49E519
MAKNLKLWFLILFIGQYNLTYGQKPKIEFVPEDFASADYEQYTSKKKFPEEIRPQVLTALSYYPQLRDTRITFRFRKRKTPLTSRPRILHVFLPKKWRAYVITISTETTESFTPILFSKLPYDAQIGVLGHEIAHIVDYRDQTSFQLISLGFKLGNPSFTDEFEFKTDERAISFGLGFQLLHWSSFVRKSLGIVEWKGASQALETGNAPKVSQRYMNPETIKDYMAKNPIYNIK